MFKKIVFKSKDLKTQRRRFFKNRLLQYTNLSSICSFFDSFYSPKPAFSLAESLVTLGIISIVAGMTLPVINNTIKDVQFKATYKKAFSIANQALLSANQQNLIATTSGEGDYTNQLNNFLLLCLSLKWKKNALQIITQNVGPLQEKNSEHLSSHGILYHLLMPLLIAQEQHGQCIGQVIA